MKVSKHLNFFVKKSFQESVKKDINFSTQSSKISAVIKSSKKITSVKDLINLLDDIQEHKEGLLKRSSEQEKSIEAPVNDKFSLWFRGQSNEEWELSPSIFRGQYSNIKKEDNKLYYMDEKSALEYLCSIRPDLKEHSLLDRLAVVQHYGLPTRLLDWSRSAVNALLFAVMDENQYHVDGNLFILNPSKLNYYSTGQYEIFSSENPQVSLRAGLSLIRNQSDMASYSSKLISSNANNRKFNAAEFLSHQYKIYKKKCKKLELPLDSILSKSDFFLKMLSHPVATFPSWKDERLLVQQGMFVVCGGKFSFKDYSKNDLPMPKDIIEIQEEALRSSQSDDSAKFILSYTIPKDCKYPIVQELRRLGIHKAQLFPDLEHQTQYAKSVWDFDDSGRREKFSLFSKRQKLLKEDEKEIPDNINDSEFKK
jgi:hypothetical protein